MPVLTSYFKSIPFGNLLVNVSDEQSITITWNNLLAVFSPIVFAWIKNLTFKSVFSSTVKTLFAKVILLSDHYSPYCVSKVYDILSTSPQYKCVIGLAIPTVNSYPKN